VVAWFNRNVNKRFWGPDQTKPNSLGKFYVFCIILKSAVISNLITHRKKTRGGYKGRYMKKAKVSC
jgi:hypothetical protein